MKLDIGSGPNGRGDVNVDVKKYEQENFILADAHDLPFREELFDRIQMNEVLEHLISPYNAILEAKRCVKNNGKIEISLPNVWWWMRIARYLRRKSQLFKLLRFDGEKFTDHRQGWDVYVFANLAHLTGLKIDEVEFYNRGIHEKTTLWKIISKFVPSALSKHNLKIVLKKKDLLLIKRFLR